MVNSADEVTYSKSTDIICAGGGNASSLANK